MTFKLLKTPERDSEQMPKIGKILLVLDLGPNLSQKKRPPCIL